MIVEDIPASGVGAHGHNDETEIHEVPATEGNGVKLR
jgi:hypothetical protein